jgi:hypothetical protein
LIPLTIPHQTIASLVGVEESAWICSVPELKHWAIQTFSAWKWVRPFSSQLISAIRGFLPICALL